MIKVLVYSQAGEGKTAVSTLIAETLRKHGIEVELVDDNGIGEYIEIADPIGRMADCIDAMSKRNTKVSIQTRQLNRNGSFPESIK